MNKDILVKTLILKVKEELEICKRIVADTKDFVTQDDMQSEGKYDTRRIEASYLAGAQEKRVKQLEIDFNILQNFNFQNVKTEEVTPGALIHCEIDEKEKYYFLTPSSGGMSIKQQGYSVQVVSINSPIGEELLGLEEGDSCEIQTPAGNKEVEILEIN